MPRNRHTHLYERYNIAKPPGSFIVYRCYLPACSHYLREEFILNKEGLCWECRTPFVMTKELLGEKKPILHPICEKCTVNTKETEAQKILDGLKGLNL